MDQAAFLVHSRRYTLRDGSNVRPCPLDVDGSGDLDGPGRGSSDSGSDSSAGSDPNSGLLQLNRDSGNGVQRVGGELGRWSID